MCVKRRASLGNEGLRRIGNRYKTSIEEDTAVIEDPTTGPRQKVAARLLRIEKSILSGKLIPREPHSLLQQLSTAAPRIVPSVSGRMCRLSSHVTFEWYKKHYISPYNGVCDVAGALEQVEALPGSVGDLSRLEVPYVVALRLS